MRRAELGRLRQQTIPSVLGHGVEPGQRLTQRLGAGLPVARVDLGGQGKIGFPRGVHDGVEPQRSVGQLLPRIGGLRRGGACMMPAKELCGGRQMIPRYTGKKMGAIWEDENKFRIWPGGVMEGVA